MKTPESHDPIKEIEDWLKKPCIEELDKNTLKLKKNINEISLFFIYIGISKTKLDSLKFLFFWIKFTNK